MLQATQPNAVARLRRMLAVTAGLAVTGAIAGAITGAIAAAIVILVVFGSTSLSDVGFGMTLAATLGAPIGAVILPLEAWVLLRRAPLWRALAETAAGTIAGALVFAVTPAGSIVGAVVGFTVAAIRLRIATRGGSPRVAGSADIG